MEPAHFVRMASFGEMSELEAALKTEPSLIGARDEDDRTPLHAAARMGRVDIVEFLILAGADINAKDSRDLTPLHWAAGRDELSVVRVLVVRGADINACDNEGATPLDFAAYANYERRGAFATLPLSFQFLSEHGAQPGKKGKKNR